MGNTCAGWYDEQMKINLEVEQEVDGRWIAEFPELPGMMVYGQTRTEAVAKAEVLALRVIAKKMEHGEVLPATLHLHVPEAA